MQPAWDQRSISSKPTTIFGFAQSGDVIEFQRMLKANPSLVYERNPIMAQTLLRVSAGSNNVQIFTLLLDGPEKVELEAQNMYGETPLHMAAKNGCNEAVEVLLSHGAFIEAIANEGLTPLDHLSPGPGCHKLRELLYGYLEEWRKHKAIEACKGTMAKMDELEHELSNIVGLGELKLQLRKWARVMLIR